jgi:Glycosyltransferase family 87
MIEGAIGSGSSVCGSRGVTKKLRVLAAGCIIAAGACLVTLVYSLSLTDKNATERDYIQYWAAEQQLAHGANPYDVSAIYRLEKSRGMEEDYPKVTVSPPIAFFLAAPLGYVSAKTGLILWLLLMLGCAAMAMLILWLLHGRPDSRWHVLVFGFPPTLSCLMAGQLGIFFLLEVTAFLYWRRTRPWLAGAALVLCALKPHLFLPALLVLLLESAVRRDFRAPGGFVAALAVCCALTLSMDRQVWTQYRQMLGTARLMDVFIPTVSVGLRFALDRSARWIEFVPEACACAWAAWYYWTRRARWEWRRVGLLVIAVSVVCAPYAWFTDEAVLFPAILAGIYAAEKSVRAWVLLGLIAAGCLVGVFRAIQLPSAFYLWTAPAWLAWYLYATGSGKAAITPAAQPSS